MVNCLPAPFTSDLKVLVMAGSNSVSERRRRQRVERLRRNEPEVPLENKAFLRLRDRLVIEYLLETLEACGLHRTWILAPEISLRLLPPRYAFRPLVQHPRATLVANLLAAYTEVDPQPNEPVLVLFGDHPLTTAATLRSFLASCGPQIDKADFFHGVALQEAYNEYMPFFRRTCLHLREMSGRASGLNLAVPSRLHRLRLIDEFYDVRKQEQLGALLGLLRLVGSWLGMRAPAALIDTLILSIAKEMEKIGRRSSRSAGSRDTALACWVPRKALVWCRWRTVAPVSTSTFSRSYSSSKTTGTDCRTFSGPRTSASNVMATAPRDPPGRPSGSRAVDLAPTVRACTLRAPLAW
jgi:hypothetical protein